MIAYGHSRPAPVQAVPAENVIMVSVANFFGRSDDDDRGSTRGTTHRELDDYQRMREVAEDVAGKVQTALDKIQSWQDRVTLDARSRELQLDWRTVEPELLEWAQAVEAQAPRVPGGDVPVGAKFATKRDWVQRLSYAGRIQLLAEAKGPASVPAQVLRIGDIVIGTSPCETFAEIGLEFKQRSPLPHSFMVSLAHGYIGYLPTPRHFELGGYETWPGTNYLEPQTSVKLLDALIEMTAGLVPRSNEKK
jgi:neutral ceramidase